MLQNIFLSDWLLYWSYYLFKSNIISHTKNHTSLWTVYCQIADTTENHFSVSKTFCFQIHLVERKSEFLDRSDQMFHNKILDSQN